MIRSVPSMKSDPNRKARVDALVLCPHCKREIENPTIRWTEEYVDSLRPGMLRARRRKEKEAERQATLERALFDMIHDFEIEREEERSK
jgi:hypothetical protein